MSAPTGRTRVLIMTLIALVTLVMGAWFALDASQNAARGAKPRASTDERSTGDLAEHATETPSIRIGENGRLTLDADSLPDEGSVHFVLALPDSARADTQHGVRIVSVDGRRFETQATPLPGAGSGVQLEVETRFLARGRYVIEIDTVENHPLQIRRYVLDLK